MKKFRMPQKVVVVVVWRASTRVRREGGTAGEKSRAFYSCFWRESTHPMHASARSLAKGTMEGSARRQLR